MATKGLRYKKASVGENREHDVHRSEEKAKRPSFGEEEEEDPSAYDARGL